MADQTRGSIEIDADVATIMKEISDFESYPEWSSEIRKAEITEKFPDGRAKRVYYVVVTGPLKADYTLEYQYAEDGTGVSWTFVEGNNMRNLEGSYKLEPDGDSTLVTYSVRVDSPVPMLGFMKRQIEKRVIDVALKGLKRRIEDR
ncbi:MAG: SRPBCC family protein [Actinomycetota bacterium]